MNVKIIQVNSNAQRHTYSSYTLPTIKSTWTAEGFELMYSEREAGDYLRKIRRRFPACYKRITRKIRPY